MTSHAPRNARTSDPLALPALTLVPLPTVVPQGALVRVTTPLATPLLTGLFGAQALLALQVIAGLAPGGTEAVGGATALRAADVPVGEGAGWILAPFVRAPGAGNRSRFSDGTYGVWYGADSLATAQAEVGFHLGQWLATTQAAPDHLERSVVEALADPARPVVDLRTADPARSTLLNPSDYTAGQAFGAACRRADFWGVLWPSVRGAGLCAGLFRPRALREARLLHTCHAVWDGQRVTWT